MTKKINIMELVRLCMHHKPEAIRDAGDCVYDTDDVKVVDFRFGIPRKLYEQLENIEQMILESGEQMFPYHIRNFLMSRMFIAGIGRMIELKMEEEKMIEESFANMPSNMTFH